jgi:hypothetical protein
VTIRSKIGDVYDIPMIQTYKNWDIEVLAHKLPETNSWKASFQLAGIEEGSLIMVMKHHLPETFGSEEEALAAAFHNAGKFLEEQWSRMGL